VEKIVESFKKKALCSFLFTLNLQKINIDTALTTTTTTYDEEEEEEITTNTHTIKQLLRSKLRTSPNVRSNQMNQFLTNTDWKKSKFGSFFKTWTPITLTSTLEISWSEEEGGGEVVDTYMISSILAPPGLQSQCNASQFRAQNLLPIVRLSAHIHRSSSGPFLLSRGRVFVGGFDTGVRTGLPFDVSGPFFTNELDGGLLLREGDDDNVRKVHPNIRGRAMKASSSSNIPSKPPVKLCDVNSEAITVAVNILIPELLMELRDPMQFLYSRDAHLIYKYWPRYSNVMDSFKPFVTKTLYEKLGARKMYVAKPCESRRSETRLRETPAGANHTRVEAIV